MHLWKQQISWINIKIWDNNSFKSNCHLLFPFRLLFFIYGHQRWVGEKKTTTRQKSFSKEWNLGLELEAYKENCCFLHISLNIAASCIALALLYIISMRLIGGWYFFIVFLFCCSYLFLIPDFVLVLIIPKFAHKTIQNRL